jgi:hypothetical protein
MNEYSHEFPISTEPIGRRKDGCMNPRRVVPILCVLIISAIVAGVLIWFRGNGAGSAPPRSPASASVDPISVEQDLPGVPVHIDFERPTSTPATLPGDISAIDLQIPPAINARIAAAAGTPLSNDRRHQALVTRDGTELLSFGANFRLQITGPTINRQEGQEIKTVFTRNEKAEKSRTIVGTMQVWLNGKSYEVNFEGAIDLLSEDPLVVKGAHLKWWGPIPLPTGV